MPLLTDIAAWAASAGHGTVGTNIFRGGLPDTPTDAIAFVSTGGGPNVESFGAIEWTQPTVQAFIRRATVDLAEVAAYALWNDFAEMPVSLISGTTYLRARPIQPPYELEVDGKGRIVYSFNVELVRGF